MNKQKKRAYLLNALVIVVCILLLGFIFFSTVGCQSVRYVKTELPEYTIEEVERPQITEVNDDTIKLIEYAKIREIQLNNFIKFYNELREQNK